MHELELSSHSEHVLRRQFFFPRRTFEERILKNCFKRHRYDATTRKNFYSKISTERDFYKVDRSFRFFLSRSKYESVESSK